jgi:hypothetical protein
MWAQKQLGIFDTIVFNDIIISVIDPLILENGEELITF